MHKIFLYQNIFGSKYFLNRIHDGTVVIASAGFFSSRGGVFDISIEALFCMLRELENEEKNGKESER